MTKFDPPPPVERGLIRGWTTRREVAVYFENMHNQIEARTAQIDLEMLERTNYKDALLFGPQVFGELSAIQHNIDMNREALNMIQGEIKQMEAITKQTDAETAGILLDNENKKAKLNLLLIDIEREHYRLETLKKKNSPQ